MKAIHLQVNHLFEPLGIDKMPFFFWHCEGGKKQHAYQIIVRKEKEIFWDSGKVLSDRMNNIPYQGKELNSRDRLEWSVKLWDEKDIQGEASSSFFEMGLLHKEDFKALWIKGDYRPNKNKRYPVDYFRKEFEVKEFHKGRLYASAKGIYDCCINGIRLKDFILAPGITDYRKRIQYQTYDVTALLKEGKNVLEISLADGWYRGSCAAYGVTNVYGTMTSVFAQLEIDGNAVVKTDESFLWSNDGPLLFADLKDGEIVDNNKTPSYSAKAKQEKQEVHLVSSNNVYVKEKEHFKAKLVKKEGKKYIFDFGQNIAGYLSFTVNAQRNDHIEISCFEKLDENNDADLKNIQIRKPRKGWNRLSLIKMLMGKEPEKDYVMTPLQKISFTCKQGRNEYKTSFSVFGFRYIEVLSDMKLKEEMFEAIALYSDMEETGRFKCSDPLINQLFCNSFWSMKSNFLDIPTDCPTRERLGWTGDAQIFFNTASYLMDVSSFFAKWLNDMEDAQYKNGVLPAVLPYEGVKMMYKATGTSVGWADAIYLLPYRYYQKYNDPEILKKCWPMIRKYAEYLFSHTGFSDKKEAKKYSKQNPYIYEKGVHLGEWLEPEEFRETVYGAKAKHPEECTAYFSYAMRIVSKIAQINNEEGFADKCKEYSMGAAQAYNDLFVKDHTIDTDRQAKLVRPLALGLLKGQTKTNVQKRLKEAIEDYDYCVGTGFLSTPFLLPVLEEAGYTKTAFEVLKNEKAPGWLFEVKAGATTIWENWEGDLSLNHYSPGAVTEWLFSSVLGINILSDNTILLKPCFSKRLDYVKGSYKSIYGDIKAKWQKKEDGFIYAFTVPCNTKAIVRIDAKEEIYESGTYHIEIKE